MESFSAKAPIISTDDVERGKADSKSDSTGKDTRRGHSGLEALRGFRQRLVYSLKVGLVGILMLACSAHMPKQGGVDGV